MLVRYLQQLQLHPGRILAVLLLAVFGSTILSPPVVNAIDAQQRHLYDNDVRRFDFKTDDPAPNCTSSGSTPASTVANSFSLGDINNASLRQANLVKSLMADFQLTAPQAAGIVGNFMHESGGVNLPPDVNEGGKHGPPAFSGGYGWAQWTGPRQRTFIDFAVAGGFMASAAVNATDGANYAYLKDELTKGYAKSITAVKGTATASEAAVIFEQSFEAAGTPNLPSRIEKANTALAAYAGGGVVAGGAGTGVGAGACAGAATGAATIVGQNAFPLIIHKSGIVNRSIFANGTTGKAGHPYTAFDILVPTGTEVVAFLSGTVTTITEDRCPGRMVSVYNKENDLTISYLHMNMDLSTTVKKGDTVTPGQHIGLVGTTANGCVAPHLHIDAAKGQTRPGCSRLNCPAANASQFVDIGPQLFTTFQALPE